MTEQQFPPSSPLLAAPEQHDPFGSPLRYKGTTADRGRHVYPTPNPSSSVGRSSSPQRQEDCEDREFTAPATNPRKISINRDFNIVNPHDAVLRVPLTTPTLTIGRSSRSCDISLNKNGVDKSISRVHVKLEHSPEAMALTCIGHNGFGIIVPRVCHVDKSSDCRYELRETGKPLVAASVSKTIHLDYQHTEFFVARGETVQMPRFPNVLVQISSSVLLINPDDCDEELTDDEGASEAKENAPAPGKGANEKDARAVKHEVATPAAAALATPQTPVKIRQFQQYETPSRQPLGERSVNVPEKRKAEVNEPPAKKAEVNEPPAKKAEVNEPPAKKAKIHDANGKLIIDHKSIKGLQNKLEIENILINHLAFSRLSSTPASVLNTILVAVAKVSLPQLRAILHNVACIGVIYRLGKDAAGKPLEEEYYYMPEHDRDPERNQLVSLIKGHGGLRACRRTHKQYYWKKPAPIKK